MIDYCPNCLQPCTYCSGWDCGGAGHGGPCSKHAGIWDAWKAKHDVRLGYYGS